MDEIYYIKRYAATLTVAGELVDYLKECRGDLDPVDVAEFMEALAEAAEFHHSALVAPLLLDMRGEVEQGLAEWRLKVEADQAERAAQIEALARVNQAPA